MKANKKLAMSDETACPECSNNLGNGAERDCGMVRRTIVRFRVPEWWVGPALHTAEPTSANAEIWTWGVYHRESRNSNGLVASGFGSRQAAVNRMRKCKRAWEENPDHKQKSSDIPPQGQNPT